MTTKNLWLALAAAIVLVIGSAAMLFRSPSPVPISQEIVAVETTHASVPTTDMETAVTQPTTQLSEAEQQLRRFGMTLEGASPIIVQ